MKRVFIGLQEVAGHYRGLHQGMLDIGIECTFVTLSPHPFQYGGDDQLLLARWTNALLQHRLKNRFRRHILAPVYLLTKLALLVYVVSRHDIFILSGKSAFFRFHELPILKLLGKKVIYQFHGSDSRPPYIDGARDLEAYAKVLECGVRIQFTKRNETSLDRIKRCQKQAVIRAEGTGA